LLYKGIVTSVEGFERTTNMSDDGASLPPLYW